VNRVILIARLKAQIRMREILEKKYASNQELRDFSGNGGNEQPEAGPVRQYDPANGQANGSQSADPTAVGQTDGTDQTAVYPG